jgi:DNA-nicking Smr family endonuclease
VRRRTSTALCDLAEIKAVLERQQRDAAAREARAHADRERERHACELFARSVGPVTPLPHSGRSELATVRPEPEPLQRRRDEAAALRETMSDGFDVDSLLETDAALSFRRTDIGPDVVRKLRRGGWVIQSQIDLHGLRRDEAREGLAAFLRESARRGLRCVRVVHGKGNGSPGREPVLKTKVQGWLVQNASVLAFAQARAADGGSGALLVLLQPKSVA